MFDGGATRETVVDIHSPQNPTNSQSLDQVLPMLTQDYLGTFLRPLHYLLPGSLLGERRIDKRLDEAQ